MTRWTVPQLLHHDDGAIARCRHCGSPAVGPCARCHAPVCGNCCVLTQGGWRVFAICLTCERRGGRSLTPAWFRVLWWIAVPILLLALIVVLLAVFGP